MSNPSVYQPKKLFSVDEANAMLPLVRAIVQDLAYLSRDVIERRGRLTHLLAGRDVNRQDIYSSELAQVEEDIEKDGRQLQEYVEELRELGVEPKNAPEGLVDFPSMIDSRLVFLCWKLGEAEVLHWHDIDAGFAGRQSLAAGSVAGGGTEASSTGDEDGTSYDA